MEKAIIFDREKHLEALRKERLPLLKEFLRSTETQKLRDQKVNFSEVLLTLPFLWATGFFAGMAAMLLINR